MDKYLSHGGAPDEVEMHHKIAEVCTQGIVELGVLFGDTSRVLLCYANPNIPVFGIDPLVPDSMNPDLVGEATRLMQLQHDFHNFRWIRQYSYDAIRTFVHPFDYLFIDADHHYEAVRSDFLSWYPWLSPGGYLAFHDSAKFRGGPDNWDGPSMFADRIIESGLMEYVDTVFSLTVLKKK